MSFSGSCLCGATRYQINRRHLNAMHCYCGMCRKAHGTAFASILPVVIELVAWAGGSG